MAGVRRGAVAVLCVVLAGADASVETQASGLTVEHTAAAICIADQFGNVGLQSYVANMVRFPAPDIFTSSGGFFGGGAYTASYSGQWLKYMVRAYWPNPDGGWFYREGNQIARMGQLGQAVHPATTWVWTNLGWRNASVNLLYNGADNARPDASLVDLPGHGTYWIYAWFWWGPITDGAGRIVMAELQHWDYLGHVGC